MEYIKKVIDIEEARSRTQGLMPYLELGGEYDIPSGTCLPASAFTTASGYNGNWGQFVADPCFLSECGKTYSSMVERYYTIQNMVRNGVKLRRGGDIEGKTYYVPDIDPYYQNGSNGCSIGEGEAETVYDYKAYDATLFLSEDKIDDNGNVHVIYYEASGETVDKDDKYIVLISDYVHFQDLASYLSGTSYTGLSKTEVDFSKETTRWSEYCKVVDIALGKIFIPSSIYNKHLKTPKVMLCSDVAEYLKWLKDNQALSGDCCNARLWEDRGGEDMINFLTASARTKCNEYRGRISGLTYTIPSIEMPLLLLQNMTDIGVLTNVDGERYITTSTTRPHRIDPSSYCGITIDMIGMGSSRVHYRYDETDDKWAEYVGRDENGNLNPISADSNGNTYITQPVEVESQIKMFRNAKKYLDDKDNVLPGMFKYFNGSPAGTMYRCIRQGAERFVELQVKTTREGTPPSPPEQPEDKRKCTVEYEYVGSSISTKKELIDFLVQRARVSGYTDDDPDIHFVTTAEPPRDKVDIWRRYYESDTAWENAITDTVNTFKEKIGTDHYKQTPLSVADSAWTMETDNVPNTPSAYIAADGLQSSDVIYHQDVIDEPLGKQYRTITTVSAGLRIAETEEEESGNKRDFMDHYYFMVKYDNSPESAMTLPYKTGNTANAYLVDSGDGTYLLYRGDYLSAITKNSDEIEFEYVTGGFFCMTSAGTFVSGVSSVGDVYKEKYTYTTNKVDYVALDGVDRVPVYSEYIDFPGAAREFYSPRYNLYRTGNVANLIETTTGEVWNEDNVSEYLIPYDAYLTKEEYLINFSLPPKVDVDVTIDRGGTSAFERHYKLGECNTMQDLENYHNGYFFPE